MYNVVNQDNMYYVSGQKRESMISDYKRVGKGMYVFDADWGGEDNNL